MSNLDKLLNSLRSVKIELIYLNNISTEDRDISWYIEQIDVIIKILESNRSLSRLFLLLVEYFNKLKGKK